MMGSITPLGQRARGSRFWPTATAYVAASAFAGLSVGVALGLVGLPLAHVLSWRARIAILAAGALAGLAADLRLGGFRLPTVHRQVNEEWMVRYRGPVYGAGFGFQLGLGFVTIVTTSAIYATLLAELLVGDVAAAALIGLTFGAARALPILAVAGVREPRQLGRVQVVLARWGTPVRRAVLWGESALAVAAAAMVLR
jgi:hypothetical protein